MRTAAKPYRFTAKQIRAQRTVTLDAAYQANPTRFTRRPQPPPLPQTAWINQPQPGDPHTDRLNPDCLNSLDTFRFRSDDGATV